MWLSGKAKFCVIVLPEESKKNMESLTEQFTQDYLKIINALTHHMDVHHALLIIFSTRLFPNRKYSNLYSQRADRVCGMDAMVNHCCCSGVGNGNAHPNYK